VKSFRMAIELDAGWAPAHAGLARALADENPPAALESARRALAIDSDLVDAHLFVAEIALDQDQPAEALAAIRRARWPSTPAAPPLTRWQQPPPTSRGVRRITRPPSPQRWRSIPRTEMCSASPRPAPQALPL